MTQSEHIKELENHIKSNRSLIYITSSEEDRIDSIIQSIACDRAKTWSLVFWDIINGATSSTIRPDENLNQLSVLEWFSTLKVDKEDFCILVLHDFYRFLGPDGNLGQVEISTIRALKNLIEKCNHERKCVILTAPIYFLPIDFEKLALVIDWPLPERELIFARLTSLIKKTKNTPELKYFKTNYNDQEIENILRAFQGLTIGEIDMISTYFILTEKEFDPIKIISKKKDIIKKNGALQWIDLHVNLSNLGGLENLKIWLQKRENAFSQQAKDAGIEPPKGILLTGIPGTGKSLAAKSSAYFLKLPLIRLDLGSIFGSMVGQSESNLRSALKLIEALAPCVLWIDEIEKGFSSGNANSDSGTSDRVFGNFLNWFQEKEASIFVVATSNSAHKLPTELIRRFDGVFFVDLPDYSERRDIFIIHLEQRGFNIDDFNLIDLVTQSDGFTGSEIESSIISAKIECFYDGRRELTTTDIINELKEAVPSSKTNKEYIDSLRKWATDRARSASRPQQNLSLKEFIKDD